MQKTKHIAINALWLSHKNITGVFVYTQNLLDNIFETDQNNTYTIFLKKQDFSYFKNRYGTYNNVSFVVVDIRQDVVLHQLRAIYKLIAKIKKDDVKAEEIVRREIQRHINRKDIDIFFYPSGIIYPKKLTGVKTISTMYDLQHEYYPENFSDAQIAFRKHNHKYTAQNSDHVIAISNYTKKTILEKYNIDPDKISTVYLDAVKLKESINTDNIELPKQFLLYPAALWPHKNHKILIEALNDLKAKFPNLHIVFTGVTKKKKLREEIDSLIKKYNLSNKIHFLGFVSDETLSYIYKKASALVFPSSFEGFGIPLIEAFRYELPVIAARNSSITEMVGDAGLLFETNNIKECKQHIEDVLTDENLRHELIDKGLNRAKDFSWMNTAEETLGVFDNI